MNKPVAWINEPYAIEAGFDNGDGTYCVLIKRLPLRTETHKDWKPHEKLLYTHPVKEQLTDEEIDEIAKKCDEDEEKGKTHEFWYRNFARAILKRASKK